MEGFDVSHYQDPNLFDWPALAKRASFLVARATYGKGIADRTFAKFAELSREHNLVFGAYLFYRQIHSVESQLDLFDQQIAAIGGLRVGELFPVLDMEENSSNGDGDPVPQRFSDDCQSIAELWREKYGGAILYYSSYFPGLLKSHCAWMLEPGYYHWLADYSRTAGKPRHPYTPIWHLHQSKKTHITEYTKGRADIDIDVINPEQKLEHLLIVDVSATERPIDVSTVLDQQRVLNTLGCSRPPLEENGIESSSFTASVGWFQGTHEDAGEVDGVSGPLTQAALLRALVKSGL